MTEGEQAQIQPPASVTSIYPPLLIMAFAGGMVLWSFNYGSTARFLPVLVGSFTFALALLDLLSRFRGGTAAFIRIAFGASFQDREMKHHPAWQNELIQIGWVVACTAAMTLIGILVSAPFFVFLYMYFQGDQDLLPSAVLAVVLLAALTLVFEIMLGYELYRGLLFGGRGFG